MIRNLGLIGKKKYVAISLGVLVASVLLAFAVGQFWFGWGYTADNEEILDSLPVPLGSQRIWMGSNPYEGDELIFTPPDGWGTRATYQASPDGSRESIVDFYLSGLSPHWQSCVSDISVVDLATGKTTKMMGNAVFVQGSSYVSVDTLNMSIDGPRTFDISVDHDRDRKPACFGDRQN